MITKHYLYSYGLKSISIVTKFVLLTLLIKDLSLEEYGDYSYFVILSGLLIFILGGDFYNYTHTSIASERSKVKQKYYISQHVFFISLMLTIFSLFFFLFIFLEGGDFQILGLFFFITLAEYLTTEYYRYLVIFGFFNKSNILLFVKSTGWVVVLLFFYFLGNQITLKTTLLFWASGLLFTCVFLYFITSRLKLGLFYFSFFTLKSMKKGIYFSIPFFISSILYKLNEFLDRFFVEDNLGSAELGVYSVFYSFTGVIQTFIFVGVLAKMYPKLLASKQASELLFYLKKLLVTTFFTVMFLSVSIFLMFDYYSYLVKRPELIESKAVFFILLLGNMFFCLSFSFHYVLIRNKESMKVLYSSLIAFFVNVLCLFFVIPVDNLWYVSLSFLLSTIFLFALKFYFSLISMRRMILNEKQ